MFDLINEIRQTLQHNKLRTALTGLSVAWGIFMLIVLLGVGNGVVNSFKEHAMSPGSQKMIVWGGYTAVPYKGYKEGRSVDLKQGDIQSVMRENSATVAQVTSTFDGSSGTLSSGSHSVNTSYTGVYPAQIVLQNELKMVQGRFINDRDMSTNAKVMVIPSDYARQLFPGDSDNVVGRHLTFGGLSYTVVGVFESRWNRSVFIPYSTAKMLAGNSDDLGSMQVMLKNISTIEEGEQTEKDIRATLAMNHNFNPDDSSAVWIWNQFTQGLRGLSAMNILTVSIWILGLLTLLSGIVGISNIMFVSVRERTHEIGIRRAIGAKPRQILIQIIAESIAITTLFGYIGILLGTIVTQILNTVFGDTDFMKNPTVSISIAIEVTIVLIIAGALAGLFPAIKSLKIKPVEALRDE